MESLYNRIGEQQLKSIIISFYDKIYQSPIAHLFQNDKDLIIEKQVDFLTQFLGGPQLYNEKYGHPRMRAKHLPHPINQEAKKNWLDCMYNAIHENLKENPKLAYELYSVFPAVAEHMVNQ